MNADLLEQRIADLEEAAGELDFEARYAEARAMLHEALAAVSKPSFR